MASRRIVGVILSRADLKRAPRMRRPPDLFELRLDALTPRLAELKKLKAPLIITARHPAEGGMRRLSAQRRAALLLQFLPNAKYVDIELRSVGAMADVIANARAKKIGVIISFHDFEETPTVARLHEIAKAAHSCGANFVKIATRTDTRAQLARLVESFQKKPARSQLAAMGMGKLGRASRRLFAKAGAELNYAHLGSARIQGQLSVAEMRKALK